MHSVTLESRSGLEIPSGGGQRSLLLSVWLSAFGLSLVDTVLVRNN
jgi:hypothetical protein